MQWGTMGLLEIALTPKTLELPPRATPGMAIGAEIAPPDPAVIGTVRIRTEMGRSVHLAAAPAPGDQAGWWSREGLMARLGGLCTRVTRGSMGEASKRFWGFGTGLDRLGGRRCRLARRGSPPAPRSMQEQAEAEQSEEQECVEKQVMSHVVPLP
jgi:hypothetical protein